MDRDALGELAYRTYINALAERAGVGVTLFVTWQQLGEADREPFRLAIDAVMVARQSPAPTSELSVKEHGNIV